MMERTVRSLTVSMIGWAALPALAMAIALSASGRWAWALGVVAGWFAGSANAVLLAIRVSRLTARSTVAGFLYGAASRFALVGAIAVLAYRLIGAYPVGFAIGIAFVVLMNVPISLVWAMRQQPVV